MARKTKAQIRKEQNEELRQWITVVILSAVIIIGIMRTGIVGLFLFNLQRYLFGNLFWMVLGLLVGLILLNMLNRKQGIEEKNPLPVILIVLGIMMLCTYADIHDGTTGWNPFVDMIALYKQYFDADVTMNASGGLIGALLYSLCSMLFGRAGTLLITAVFFIIAALLMVSLDVYKKAFATIYDFFRTPESQEPHAEEPIEEKDPFNLWEWIVAHRKTKEPKPKKRPVIIETEAEEEPESYFEEEEEVPVVRTLYNIRADGPTQEIPVVQIPGKVISSRKSVFINVADVMDAPFINEEAVPYEEEPEPAYEPQEWIEAEEEEIYEPDVIPAYEPEAEEAPVQAKPKPAPAPKPRKNKPYRMPNPNALLDNPARTAAYTDNETAAAEKGELLLRILRNFDIEAELIDTHIGPSVTQFEIRPDVSSMLSSSN